MSDMTDKVVVITGASRGIGHAAAKRFAAAGARVVLLARNADAIAELSGEIGRDQALAVPCDVARFWEVEAAVGAALETWGRLDVMINNAGVIEPVAHMADADPDAWGQTVDVNLKGAFHGIRAALPAMLKGGGGTILNVSSGAATNPVEGWSHYCAAKAGVLMMTRQVHLEYGQSGIRALGLSPGTVATQMQKEIKASGVNRVSQLEWSDHIPPEWPAEALVWMCSDAADDWRGGDISLRDEAIRATLGLG